VATVALFLLPLGGVLANALEQMREHAREHTVRARDSERYSYSQAYPRRILPQAMLEKHGRDAEFARRRVKKVAARSLRRHFLK
jgi:hypothetical protein